MPAHFTDPDALAESVIAQVGKKVVLGLPLGLGKATHIANALYQRAAKDNSITARGVAPTPLQTAGALLGALFAIILAIAGVTLTFRAMRNETRHGRGRSRRNSRPESATLHQT